MYEGNLSRSCSFSRVVAVALAAVVAFSTIVAIAGRRVEARVAKDAQETESMKVGERMSYLLSLDGFGNVGYAELWVASRTRFEGADVFEVRLKLKTFDVVNAAFFPIDEVRTAYLDTASGLPLAVRRVSNPGGIPQEQLEKVPGAPSALDIIALIYKVRRAGGEGKFRLSSGGDNFWVEMKSKREEVIKTDVGSFNARESSVSSRYFRSIGISDLKVHLSEDDARLPLTVTFKTSYGAMTARLSSYVSSGTSGAAAQTDTVIKPAQTPTPVRPKPTPVKIPYVENRPLGDDLPFALGERLVFRIKSGEAQIGKLTLEARERKLFEGQDSLAIVGTVNEALANAQIFAREDYLRSFVDPGSLLPLRSEIKFNGALSVLNHSVKFDQANGLATAAGSAAATIPSNTHTLLSLLYAARSFNLKSSKSEGNPVNDTRVSVWWNGQSGVYTIRPLELGTLTVEGKKVMVQQVGLVTGNPQLDSLNIRVWITNDSARLPMKVSVGGYTAELVPSESRSR